MATIYLRDLRPSVQDEVEREIRRSDRTDLIAVLDRNNDGVSDRQDIEIGEYLKLSKYEIV